MKGIQLIEAERQRQITAEGFTPRHDEEHVYGELSQAAECYALIASAQCRWNNPRIEFGVPAAWPWDEEWWKPSPDPIRNLVKAGALIAAEIDRLQRLSPKEEGARG